jgi:hypothetical protein
MNLIHPYIQLRNCAIAGILLCACQFRANAQWVTEDYPVKAGWNAIWLSADASHDSIQNLVNGHSQDLGGGSEEVIKEVWRWNPISSTARFNQVPEGPPAQADNPVQPDTQWFVYERGFPANTTMTTFVANAAYLVRVADGATDFTLQITGKPVPPNVSWSSSGLNFFGFPMQTPDNVADRNFEAFLAASSSLSVGADIFRYVGGPLGAANPAVVSAPRLTAMSRGQAYWIRSGQYSDYYGPLRVTVARFGLDFGDTTAAVTLRVENVTSQPVTATLAPAASVAAPASQSDVAGDVPLLLRSALNPTTGQFAYDSLAAASSHLLAAGEFREFVIAVDRAAMAGAAGDVFQSLLQITDSLSISRVDLPVRAVTTSRSGLWIGAAVATQVDQVTAAPNPQSDGTATVTVTRDAAAETPASFPIRLILHRADNGTVKLLQQVYIGLNTSGDMIITPSESLLDPSTLKNARRLSSASFPLDHKVNKTNADLGLSGFSRFSSVLGHAAATNPFLHIYHPDHDNKDPQFSPVNLPNGDESFTITRRIDLTWGGTAAAIGLSELGWGSTVLGGAYLEVVTGLRAQSIAVRGNFVLRRVSSIGTLTE